METLIDRIIENIELGEYQASPNGRALMQHDFQELREEIELLKNKVESAQGYLDEVKDILSE